MVESLVGMAQAAIDGAGATLTLLRLRHRGSLVFELTNHDRRARSSAG
jgi:hypothetical protein